MWDNFHLETGIQTVMVSELISELGEAHFTH